MDIFNNYNKLSDLEKTRVTISFFLFNLVFFSALYTLYLIITL